MNTTFYFALDNSERSIIMYPLNNLQNRPIKQNKYTDAVDDRVLQKIKDKNNFLYKKFVFKKWNFAARWGGLPYTALGSAHISL